MPNADFHHRNIPPDKMKSLKNEISNQSISALILRFVERRLDLIYRVRKPRFNDLDDLTGTWTEEDKINFESLTKCFEYDDNEKNV